MRRIQILRIIPVLASAIVMVLLAGSSVHADIWEPPEPTTEKWDWIQMSSGEWFKGEIKSLRDVDFEFDSDELDLLSLDWEDVAVLRTARALTYRIEHVGVFTGTAVMRDGTITIRSKASSRVRFLRSQSRSPSLYFSNT